MQSLADQHQATLHAANEQLQQLCASAALDPQQAVTPPTSRSHPQLAPPVRFFRNTEKCWSFLTQCKLHFELQSDRYATDHSWVAFVISHLEGRAGRWATMEWDRCTLACDSYNAFSTALTLAFQAQKPGREAALALVKLQQRSHGVSDH